MPTRFFQYTLIALAGYLFTGLPAAAMVLCFSCTAHAPHTTASQAGTSPPPITTPTHTCCGIPIPIAQAEPTQPQDATPPDDPHPQPCCLAVCCKAAPTLTHRPTILNPLLLTGTRQAAPPAILANHNTPLDPPPPRV